MIRGQAQKVNLDSSLAETAILDAHERRVGEMSKYGWYVLPVVFLWGCPLVEPPRQPLSTGCAICPPGTLCETTEADAGSVPSVQCVPEGVILFQPNPDAESMVEDDDGGADSGGGLADSGGLGSDGDSEVSGCSETGCPCTEDSTCLNGSCGMLGGETACTLNCPEACVESDCPNACPDGWTCQIGDDGTSLCWL